MAMASDALGSTGGERELRESGNGAVQRRTVDPCPSSSLPLGQGSTPEVLEDQMRLWEKVELMEISGNGQNMHFKFLPEGV